MSSLSRYFHTLRYLKPVQIYGRLLFRVRRPTPRLAPAPPRRAPRAAWPGPLLREPSMVARERFRLLAREHTISSADDWQRADRSMLWMYNLHYFDDLNAEGARAREEWHREIVARWIRENEPGRGVGWHPYPISLRLVAWARWILRGNDPVPGQLESMAIQARYLMERLETHLLGNHLFVNAKALVFAGAFFEGPEADAWLDAGRRILAREIEEQILADGGHFERSPMYHALLLEDVLDLLALDRVFERSIHGLTNLEDVAARMLEWLLAMTHPDGSIVLFNDATAGVAATTSALAVYARELGVISSFERRRVIDLAASGYARVEMGDAALFVDAAPIGPDYLPGHGHADALTFELSVRGRRVMVDAGISEYGASNERLRQRGSRAHNVVVVDGEDSSEVWADFRVARRARVLDRVVDERPDGVTIRASHDGYRRLRGGVVVRRTWEMRASSLEIEDEVVGDGRHRVELFFHLAPGLVPSRSERGWSIGEGVEIETDASLAWRALADTQHPAIGTTIATHMLHGSYEGALPLRARTRVTW